MRIIYYIGTELALLAERQGNQVNILSSSRHPPVKQRFFTACTIKRAPIHLERWQELVHMYINGTKTDQEMLQQWILSSPNCITYDQPIKSETPFARPAVEDSGTTDTPDGG